jgi:hypothetical protein
MCIRYKQYWTFYQSGDQKYNFFISTLKTEAVHSSEMLVNYYHSTQRHLTKGIIFRHIFMRQDVGVTVTNVQRTDEYGSVQEHTRKSRHFNPFRSYFGPLPTL